MSALRSLAVLGFCVLLGMLANLIALVDNEFWLGYTVGIPSGVAAWLLAGHLTRNDT